MAKRISHRSVGMLAAAAAVGLAGFGASQQADAGLIVDVRATQINGAPAPDPKNVVVATGDVVTLQMFATVQGANSLNDEGFQSLQGSFRSTNGGLLGDLTESFVANSFFRSPNIFQNGVALDVDGDGDLDIGPAPTEDDSTKNELFFAARSGEMQNHHPPASPFDPPKQDGVPVAGANPAAESWLVGQMKFTATGSSGQTLVEYVSRTFPNGEPNLAYGAWNEDDAVGDPSNPQTSTVSTNGVTIAVPEPTGLALAGLGALGLLARRRKNA